MLTERRDHLAALVEELRDTGLDPSVLHGGIGEADRRMVLDRMACLDPDDGDRRHHGPYVGEGFDCPPLDTLFVTFPMSFKGTVVQYIGRLLRLTDAKDTLEVRDYLDAEVDVLRGMHNKRRTTYDKLGFSEPQ